MSSLLESDILALFKNFDTVEEDTQGQSKDGRKNYLQSKAENSTATQVDPADVLLKNPDGVRL